jgi:quinol monooxygenase YgiN/mannose-6-phosphate isomerase-like protein (cupin superfamily)
MTTIGRYVKFTANEGQADALAERLRAVAEVARDVPGCELYVVNRAPADPGVVWVTEIWRSQEDADAARESAGEGDVGDVMALVDGVERIDLEVLGGAGLPAGGSGFTRVNLESVEDMAPKFGYGEMGEARFAREDLEAEHTGVSHQRVRPGVRQAFAHRHRSAEEVIVVLSGSGRARIDDEIVDVGPRDAIRIAPASTRKFEAGDDGLELLIFGPHRKGDAVMVQDFWTD